MGRDPKQLVWKKESQKGKWGRTCDYLSGWIVHWCVPSLQLAIEFLTRCVQRDPLLRLIYLPLTKNLTFLVLFDFSIQRLPNHH